MMSTGKGKVSHVATSGVGVDDNVDLAQYAGVLVVASKESGEVK